MGVKQDLLTALSKATTAAERIAIQAQIDRLVKARGDAAAGVQTTPFVLPEDYTVQAGDSAFSIAEALYGDQRAAFDIMAANPDIFKYDPRTGTYTTTIHPGQTLNVPQGAVGDANVPANVGFREASGDTVFFGTTPGSQRVIPSGAAVAVIPAEGDQVTAVPTIADDDVTKAFREQEAATGQRLTPEQQADAFRDIEAATGQQLSPEQQAAAFAEQEAAFIATPSAGVTPEQLEVFGRFAGLGVGGVPSRGQGVEIPTVAAAGELTPESIASEFSSVSEQVAAGEAAAGQLGPGGDFTPETGPLTGAQTTARDLNNAVAGTGDFPTMTIADATAIGISPQLAAQLGYVVVGDEYIPTGASGAAGTQGFTPGAYFIPTFGFDPTGSTRYQRGRRGGSRGRGRRSTTVDGYHRWNISFS